MQNANNKATKVSIKQKLDYRTAVKKLKSATSLAKICTFRRRSVLSPHEKQPYQRKNS